MTNILSAIIFALMSVESGGRPDAIGDGGRSVGILQMRPVAVREANRIVGTRRWTYADRLDPFESEAMCRVTLERHWRRGVRDPVALACRWRNPDGRAPAWYRQKVRNKLNEVCDAD